MIHRIIQMAEELGEPHFCARIIMHMPHMHISAIIMLLKILAIDGSLLSQDGDNINPWVGIVNLALGKSDT